jgi:hypothetical protein
MESVKKFDPKKYYIENKERILNYNRKYFKEYYKKRKQKLSNPIINNLNETIDNRTNNLIIEKNVTVYF